MKRYRTMFSGMAEPCRNPGGGSVCACSFPEVAGLGNNQVVGWCLLVGGPDEGCSRTQEGRAAREATGPLRHSSYPLTPGASRGGGIGAN